MKHPDNLPSNRDFFRILVSALLFLALGAIVLTAGFLLYHSAQIREQEETEPIVVYGNNLRFELGSGKREGKALLLDSMQDGYAVLNGSRQIFDAERYPFLEYRIRGIHPGVILAFYWRTADAPQQVHFVELPWTGLSRTVFRMEAQEKWRGRILDFGLSISGDLRNGAMEIRQLRFQAYSYQTLLLAVWSEWLAFQGWQQHSINAVRGGVPNAMVPPVVAAVTWSGVALLLFALWRSFPFPGRNPEAPIPVQDRTSVLVMVTLLLLVPWFALDARWQLNLWRQHGETWKQFAGKSYHEQHLSAQDAGIYEYALHLRDSILPQEPRRIFILQSEARHYIRLKLMYYLLPHMVYNYGDRPDPRKLMDGDYLLVVNPLPGITYDKRRHLLHYNKQAGHRMNADLLDRNGMGMLYRARNTVWLYRKALLKTGWVPLYREGRLMDDPLYFVASHPCLKRNRALVRMIMQSNGVAKVDGGDFDCEGFGSSSRSSVKALIVNRGSHRLASGKRVEVDRVTVKGGGWREVRFAESFDKAPALYLSVQPGDAPPPETLRVRNVTPAGFEVMVSAVDTQDSRDEGFTVAFMAVDGTAKKDALLMDGVEVPIRIRHVKLGEHWAETGGRALRLDFHGVNATLEEVDLLFLKDALFAQVVSANAEGKVRVRIREGGQRGSVE